MSEMKLSDGHNLYLLHFNNVKELFPDISKIKTLEAGCYTAYFSIPYAISAADVYCIDNGKKELEAGISVFKKFNLKSDFILMDANKMGFPDNCFDLVFNMGVLEHFDEKGQDRMIKEMARVSKKYIYITVPNKFHWQSRKEIKEAKFRREKNIGPEWDQYVKPLHVFELKGMIERNGLRVVKIIGSAHQFDKIPMLGIFFKRTLGTLLGYEICVLASKE